MQEQQQMVQTPSVASAADQLPGDAPLLPGDSRASIDSNVKLQLAASGTASSAMGPPAPLARGAAAAPAAAAAAAAAGAEGGGEGDLKPPEPGEGQAPAPEGVPEGTEERSSE